ncbi:uncharacterized protein LOC128557767 isoform X1 [Mercenaria mercenaria]|uniref:uncharacterized protein LOC128557767 isoform X1 n=1 Tax=Mercenaria mercenaria TaxID=6596 RepID=UPI00234E7F33|nr:uncharacterized protein LOC128557767 isoform X1 [Mercenaria mercenaria]XP_053401973.1 uncharacterized protein LOC128557767 isoform X1 [Mercenaria mercenaria]XP_053401975.1 uncharacterized protein LOC128557767 isoform X1 [Mercenaria mercenaria]XP_053401976.1 uncharacterized protein LOC128557767 isoform X1 [Mercenaria mercenaria]XP_053401977.1 uncharacterized protein LOC128557767 isoform X1 [Mercenaria mercenaria]
MASGNQKKDNTVPRCFKHNKTWQPRIQQLLNKIRDSLLPKIYLGRFNNLLCTCDQGIATSRPGIVSLWDEVTDEQLAQAVGFIDRYVLENIGNANVPIMKKIMEWLRKDKEINAENSTAPQPAPRSSALKLLFLLRKVIDKDYSVLEPRKVKAVQQAKKKEKEELNLTVVLEDYKPELLGQLVGFCGRNIMTFMKREKCHVRFEKVQTDNGAEKVKATIKKTTESMSELENIATELKKFATETQDTVEAYVPSDDEEITPEVLSVYDEVDQMNQDELKEEYKELVEAVDKDVLGPNTQFADVSYHYTANPSTRYKAITKKMTLVNQIQAFNEVKSKLVGQAKAPQSPASHISSLSIGQSLSTATRSAATDNTVPKSAASGDTSASKASQSGASSTGGSTNQMAGASTLVHPIDLNDPAAADPCPTKCLVHDRRWVSTYQYTLTQCYTHIRLPKKFGSRFSRLICTCNKNRPEARLYFVVEDYMVKGFGQCKEKVERWPQECQVIMKPLITQLEKYDKSEVWHSLFKFVFYFNSVDANLMDVFDIDHKLPGQNSTYVPRQEKPYLYQASVPLTIVRPASTATQSTASSGASGSYLTQSGAGASGLSSYRSILFQSVASAEPSPQSTRKRPTLKRLSPDDWSEDCYYHGKKKKFVFQCVVNYLHKHAGLPVKLNIPYSMAVCVCNETVDFKDLYKTENDCESDCRTMKIKLSMWRGDSKSSIQPYIGLLEDYIYNKNITDGFLKLVYHFNQVYRRELGFYEELHNLVKKQRNLKK